MTLEVNGREYEIDADFRSCLRTMLAFEDPDLVLAEKYAIFVQNLFVEQPDDVEAALQQGVWFLNCGASEDDAPERPRVFSWEKDAGLIFAAFQQTHGIDLQAVGFLHWWKFMALFMDLGSETAFCHLVGLRKRVKTGKASKEERAAAREMGAMFTIEEVDNRTLEEREAERAFMDMVHGRIR